MDLVIPETVLPGLARRVERAEANAWMDLFTAAPEDYAREHGLRVARLAPSSEVVVLRSSGIPFPLFNRALGLGLSERATPGLVDRVLALLREGGAARFLVHLVPAAQPEALAEWLAERGLQILSGWDRLLRDGRPLDSDGTSEGVGKVTPAMAEEWTGFVDRLYGLPTGPWLAALVGRPGWFHFVLRRGGKVAAARSMYVHHDGMAWLGIEAPVPGIMTSSAADDLQLCQALVQAGLAAGADTFITDVEKPSPDGRGEAYEGFARLGFERLYLRQNWGPGT